MRKQNAFFQIIPNYNAIAKITAMIVIKQDTNAVVLNCIRSSAI